MSEPGLTIQQLTVEEMNQNKLLTKIAARLYERQDEGRILKSVKVYSVNWEPIEKGCHQNVFNCCKHEPKKYTPVRGWLYHEYEDRPYVDFNSHSVVRADDGELYDITPSKASQLYPFIVAEETDTQFAELVNDHNARRIRRFK